MSELGDAKIVGKLKSVSRSYVAELRLPFWAETVTQPVPIGEIMHEAADEIERLRALLGHES